MNLVYLKEKRSWQNLYPIYGILLIILYLGMFIAMGVFLNCFYKNTFKITTGKVTDDYQTYKIEDFEKFLGQRYIVTDLEIKKEDN